MFVCAQSSAPVSWLRGCSVCGPLVALLSVVGCRGLRTALLWVVAAVVSRLHRLPWLVVVVVLHVTHRVDRALNELADGVGGIYNTLVLPCCRGVWGDGHLSLCLRVVVGPLGSGLGVRPRGSCLRIGPGYYRLNSRPSCLRIGPDYRLNSRPSCLCIRPNYCSWNIRPRSSSISIVLPDWWCNDNLCRPDSLGHVGPHLPRDNLSVQYSPARLALNGDDVRHLVRRLRVLIQVTHQGRCIHRGRGVVRRPSGDRDLTQRWRGCCTIVIDDHDICSHFGIEQSLLLCKRRSPTQVMNTCLQKNVC